MIRIALIGMVALSVVYISLWLYARAAQREKLQKLYETGDHTQTRADFVQDGLAAYEKSWRKKALLLVFIVPIGTVVTLVYVQNLM